MKKKFEVIFLEDALSCMDSLGEKEREKIIYNIRKAQIINDKNLFKKLDDDIWEVRTLYSRTYYRLFAFWDKSKNAYVVATNGIIKKTGKTPKIELKKAKQIMNAYMKNKDENAL